MRLNTFLAAAAIAALTAGTAVAQTSDMSNGSGSMSAPMNSGSMNNGAMAPSADQAGMPASAMTNDPNTAVASSPTPAADAYTLKAGDPNVVSNQPVPDTRANRAQFGKPLSNAGRHTAATGD